MSKKLKQLRQRLHDLKTEATGLLDAAEARDDGALTEAESKRLGEIKTEIAGLDKQIKDAESLADIRRDLDAVQTLAPALSVTSPELDPKTTDGFKSLDEFGRSVRLASTPTAAFVDPRLKRAAPTNFHEGGGAAGEGFELPVHFRNEIWQMTFDAEDLLGDIDIEPTTARQVSGVSDETTPWGASGIQAYWRSEGGQMTASKMGTKARNLDLHELYAFVLATEELLEDAPRLNNRLGPKSAQAIGWKIGESIMFGNGAGQPQGWMNSTALVSIAKESGQAADSIVAANVLKMYSRLLVAPGDKPYWMANRDTVPQLSTILIGDKPAWMPPNGLIDAPGGFLLGYPIKWSEHCKTLGDKGDLQLVSPKGYYAARRTQGVQFASSMHLYFDYGMQAFRWLFRFGGHTHLSAAVSPAKGTNTKSHFVTLDERA